MRERFARLRVRLRGVLDWLRPRYFRADPRTLALLRIVVGLLLIADALRHARVARLYYSNDGVLTNHYSLFRPSSSHHFSIFHAFSSPEEVWFAFGLAIVCYACFVVGYRTRLFTVLSFLWVTSLDSRLVLRENGGYVVANLVLFWSCFLPLGRRWSVDAWRASARRWFPQRLADLDARPRGPDLTRPHESLAVGAALANFGIVYFFNVVNKYGSTWRKGLTVQYVLHLDRMVTGIAVWLRELLPDPLMRVSCWSVLVVEASIVMLIFWPRRRLLTRPVANVLILLLHTAFGVVFRLGPFSWFMIGWSMLLVPEALWALGDARQRATAPRLTLRAPEGDPLALRVGRAMARLDGGRALRFETGPVASNLGLFDVHEGEQRLEGRAAADALMLAMAGTWLPWRLARRASLGLAPWMLGGVFRSLGRFRAPLGRFFGPGVAPGPRDANTRRTPLGERLRGWRIRAREGFALAWVLLFVSQMLIENKSIPEMFKPTHPRAVAGILIYPRLFQGWGMFAPNPVRTDGVVAVDAITIDGRHVDPFTGEAPDLNLSDARGLGLGQIEQDYFNRIRLDRNRGFRLALREYFKRWHRITGRDADRIVAFDVYWLEDTCPEPGLIEPTDHRRIPFMSWRLRGHRPKKPLPPLPPKLETESAGD